MTNKSGFLLEIDGERVEFTGIYDGDDDVGWVNGNIYGMTEHTAADDPVRGFLVHKCLAFVNVYRKNPDGSIWGIKGIFRKGEWTKGENDKPLYRVWDRLA
jgi:hypothetical protein